MRVLVVFLLLSCMSFGQRSPGPTCDEVEAVYSTTLTNKSGGPWMLNNGEAYLEGKLYTGKAKNCLQGQLWFVNNYVNGLLQGRSMYYVNGFIAGYTDYKDGKQHGESVYYNNDGSILQKKIYVNGVEQ